MNEEEKRRLEAEFDRLHRTPKKPCKWIKDRLEYGTFWTMGFFIGLRIGLGMK